MGYHTDEINTEGMYHLASKISISRTTLDWVLYKQVQEFRGWSDHPQTGMIRNDLALYCHFFHTSPSYELFLTVYRIFSII